MAQNATLNRPVHYGVLLFPTFQLLDVMGPVDVFTLLSRTQHPMKLSMISDESLDPVSNNFKYVQTEFNQDTFGTQVVPQYTFATAPADIDVLIVPGGAGTRSLEHTQPHVDFIRRTYPRLKYILSVCTGSSLLARAGILDGRKATSNKRAWDWVVAQGPEVVWIRQARWVQDGNIWTTSGISAGIDGALAFVGHLYGESVADGIARGLEYIRAQSSTDDPFA